MPGKRTLVKPYDKDATKGGIIVPNRLKGESALEGTVEEVGPECIETKRGDHIVFAQYSKFLMPLLEGEYKNYLVVDEANIICYIEEE